MTDTDGVGGNRGEYCSYTIPDVGPFDDHDDSEWELSNFAVTQADRNHTIAAVAGCARAQLMNGTIVRRDGTSLAAPAVAGILYLADFSRCLGDTPGTCYAEVRLDAQNRTTANPNHGFIGDPRYDLPGRYYGYLITADPY